MIDETDRSDLADQLRDFADRVEDGELAVTEIAIHNTNPPRVAIEGMNRDELERIGRYFNRDD